MEHAAYHALKQNLLTTPYTWLITGVAGFIGSHLLETLLKCNQKVIGIDNFATGFKKNLEDVLSSITAEQRKNFAFYENDICSMTDGEKLMEGTDFVLHQAALGSVPRSISTPHLTHMTNATGFLTMLMAAKKVNVKRFIYASSSSVYGDSHDLPKKEEKIGNPLSPYAVSKYTNELYAKAFSTCYGMQIIGLRYFNVFGSRQDAKGQYAAVIPLWIKSLLRQEPVYINGDGETSRDFCYVENVIQANLLAALTPNEKAVNQVYNIAVGEQTTLKKMYTMMATILGSSSTNIIYRDARPGDIRHSLANIDKAKALLGYCPLYKLNDGLCIMIPWYQKHLL